MQGARHFGQWTQKIKLGLPGRDQQLTNWCRSIENLGAVGVPVISYCFALRPSAANGLTFCVGTIAEMPGDVFDAIRNFGTRDKIHFVHFRNVTGTVPTFAEAGRHAGGGRGLTAARRPRRR